MEISQEMHAEPLPVGALWSFGLRSATGLSGWDTPATAELPRNVCVRLWGFCLPAEPLCIVAAFLAALVLVGRGIFPLKCLFSERERRNPACLPPHERAEVRDFFLTKSKHGYFWIQRENKKTTLHCKKNKNNNKNNKILAIAEVRVICNDFCGGFIKGQVFILHHWQD